MSDLERAREAREMRAENKLLRDILTTIVAEFTVGDQFVQCAHCGKPVETCRCVIDLARIALGAITGRLSSDDRVDQ